MLQSSALSTADCLGRQQKTYAKIRSRVRLGPGVLHTRAVQASDAAVVLEYGDLVSSEPNKASADVATASLACSKCGASLPDEAQFCLKCGKPVSVPQKRAPIAGGAVVEPQAAESRAAAPKRRRLVVLLLLVILFLLAGLWSATSDNPFAEGIQELVGWKHDRTILQTEAPFVVAAHSFRYYKFQLPEGSVHVSIVGQFTAGQSAVPSNARNAKPNNQNGENDKVKGKDADADANNDTEKGIEVYVLSEPAFTVWQNGYATSSVYESGRVSEGTVQAELPTGAGIYYLVFSNKSSARMAKSVSATALLRYKSWVPDWFRRFKEWFWDWTGF
jgi:hypothetical protein